MQTLSSARRTCMALASACECTATVEMPSSLQARRIRSAISPRLAMRTFWNNPSPLFDDDQGFAIFDRLGILDEDTADRPRAMRRNLIHGLHGLDDEDRLALRDLAADLDEGRGIRLRRTIGGAHHWRGQR